VHISGSALDYNELKLPVLQILFKVGSADSKQLSKELAGLRGITIDIHALRMALMRYYKQGLLKRERRGGMFSYALSERGVQRLRWLEMSSSQTQESQPQ
jgi:DNA-binding transcriptional regulator PaaX